MMFSSAYSVEVASLTYFQPRNVAQEHRHRYLFSSEGLLMSYLQEVSEPSPVQHQSRRLRMRLWKGSNARLPAWHV